MKIAFTGATGQYGRLLAGALLERTDAANLVALARDPRKAASLEAAGIEVRQFDYDNPSQLAPALEGIDRLVMVSGSEVGRRVPQHRAVIEAATEAGVQFVAYTSFLHADDAEIIAVAPEHQATESLLAQAPFAVALLRNGWYSENFEDLVKQTAAGADLLTSAGEGLVSSAARKDYAEAAAAIITAPEPIPGTYELAGDQAWGFADLATDISRTRGKPVEVRNVTADQHRQILTAAGLPAGAVDFLVSTDQAIAKGELEDPAPGTLSSLIGHPTTAIADLVDIWVA